jgi:predicted nuclease with TOPRIM domain
MTLRAWIMTMRGRVRERLCPDLQVLRYENELLRRALTERLDVAREVEAEVERLRAELSATTERLENRAGTVQALCAETVRLEAERDEARAELTRLTTLRWASERDDDHDTKDVLWWRKRANASLLPSFYKPLDTIGWTPLPDVKEPK